jgi:TonB-linked SusC/RagA family outer membrane protein
MKKIKLFYECDFRCLMKTFKIIRITVFLLLVSNLQIFANDAYSQETRLSPDYLSEEIVQQNSISGTVSDESGNPLPGVTVLFKGTTNGTVTNYDGEYSISDIPADATLAFSFVGMIMQEILVGNQTTINVTLVADAIGIEEVIAVGYGSKRKVNLIGAVSSLKSEELEATKSQNVQNMLTGKLPGVRVIQKTSEPGVFSNQFDIRGFGAPLIVVDGVPRDDMERLDPSEIESVSVLKDASAAVYGVRAANGVVLISTKKGEKGAPKFSYSMFYGVQVPAEVQRPVGAIDRMTLFNEKTMRSTSNPKLTFSDEEFEKYYNGTLISTDWYDAVMQDYAPQQQHNINLTGGSKQVNYFINVGLMEQEGFWKTGDMNYDRINLRSNIDAEISDRLRLSLKLNGIIDNRNSPLAGPFNVFKALWRSPPDEPIYANNNPDFLKKPADINNVVALIDSDISGFRTYNTKIFQSSIDLTYDIPGIKGLTAKGLFSYDTKIGDNTIYSSEYSEYNYDIATETYTGILKNLPTNLDRTYGVTEKILYQISLNYKRNFGAKHNVNSLLLFEGAHIESDNIFASREFTIPLPYLFAGNAQNQEGTASSDGINEYARNGLVGKFNYDYSGKYLAEFSFRYDGSSKFPEGTRWGFFPAGSIGWRVSEESFVKNNLAFVNNIKLRASYGKMGDDGALNYQFISGYDYPNTAGYREKYYPTGYMMNGIYTNALGFRAAANPNITWYTVNTLNIGLDVDLWKSKLGFTFDYFDRKRDGLLANRLRSLPGTFGSQMPQENVESDRTSGVELELRHRNRIGGLSYNIAGHISVTRSSNLYVEMASAGNSYDNWRNHRDDRYNDIWFGYGDAGRYTSYEEIATSDVFTSYSTLPGDYIYEDWNNDGVITSADMHPIATTTNPDASHFRDKNNYPLMNFGLNMSAEYKGFDLNLLFQGAAMSYVAMGEQLTQPLSWDGNALDQFLDRWHPVDPKMDPYDPNNEWISGNYAYGARTASSNSMFVIQNGSYVRLKSIELGYTIPKHLLGKINIGNIRVYVNAYNLLTITGVEAIDPEHPAELYGYMYPLNKTINLGAKILF